MRLARRTTGTERAIRQVRGVRGVVEPHATAGDVRSKIEAALKRNAQLDADAIKDAEVTLDGKVHAWPERNFAERAAWSAPGVKAVEDTLVLA